MACLACGIRLAPYFFVSGHMSDAAHSLAYRNPERLVKVPNPAHCPLPTAANFGDSTQIPQELLYAGGSGGKALLIGGSLLRTSACRVLTALGRIEVLADCNGGSRLLVRRVLWYTNSCSSLSVGEHGYNVWSRYEYQ